MGVHQTTSPPPPTTPPTTNNMNPELQSAIGQGAALKHAETVDKSAPQIENVTVKKVDRSSFLEEVAKPHELKHAETVDKSGPAIPEDVHVKKVDRGAFLSEIEKAAKQ